MTVVQIPPADLTVYLRLRCTLEPVPCHFSFDDRFQCQLDTALLNDDRIDRSCKESIGILVDDTVYVNDEPYWRNLLEQGATYDVVYLRRTFWRQSPLVSLWDACYKTPLLDAVKIPTPSERYKTRNARGRILAAGFILTRRDNAMSTVTESATGKVGPEQREQRAMAECMIRSGWSL